MAASSGFSVGINAVDKATPILNQINKRISAMTAPAERFNKSMQRFGDVSGLSRLSEGVGGLGHNLLDAFRSADRLAGPMASLTGAASIAGVTALVDKYSQLGTKLTNLAYKTNMPASGLSKIEQGAKLAGVSIGTTESSMEGLQRSLSDATYHGDAQAVTMFNALGVSFRNADGSARNAADAIGDVAEGLKKWEGNGTKQAHVLSGLGISPDLLPALKNGRAGLEDLEKQAVSLGGTMTDKMIKDADATAKSFTRLSEAIEGVGNRLAEQASGPLRYWIDRESNWIAKNQATADSIAKIGAGILALGALKPAAWVVRLLGLGVLVPGAVGAAVGAAAGAGLAAGAEAGAMNVPMTDDYGRVVGNWGGGNAPEPSAAPPGWRSGPGYMMRNWRKFDQPGRAADVTLDPTKRAFLDTIAGPESGGDYQMKNGGSRFTDMSQFPDYVGPDGTSTASGRYQFVSRTWRSVSSSIGARDFKPESQDKAGWYLAETTYRSRTGRDLAADLKTGGREATIADALKDQWPSLPGGTQQLETIDQFKAALARHTSMEKAAVTPLDAPYTAPDPLAATAVPRRSADDPSGASPTPAPASAHLTVEFKNAPPGVVAHVVTKGPMTASPPQIGTSMPGAR